jgi:molecular chaperone DnaJ
MSAINEAYRVLGDDVRRAAYDLQLNSVAAVHPEPSQPVTSTPPAAAWPSPGPPARIPWRLMAAMAAIGIAVVLVGAALRGPTTARPPDGVVRPGSCVSIEPNNDVREVNCDGDGDLVVEVVVAFEATCPTGTEPHRDRQGLGLVCVIPAATP